MDDDRGHLRHRIELRPAIDRRNSHRQRAGQCNPHRRTVVFHRANDRVQRRLTCFKYNCHIYSYTWKTSLACGQNVCTATTGGDGTAMIAVTPTTSALAAVTASIANGASVTTEFIGALNPTLYLAQGTTFEWTPQALALSNALPYPRQTIT
jgi:hypothetical protein